jgi:choline kinase
MIRLTAILSEQSIPKVVFVSGLTRYESVAQQAARIQSGMPQFTVVPFKWDQDSAVKQYLEKNKPAALILYSKSVEYTQHIASIYLLQKYMQSNLISQIRYEVSRLKYVEASEQGLSRRRYKWK